MKILPTNDFQLPLDSKIEEIHKKEGGLRVKGFLKSSYPNKPLVTIITVVYNGDKYLEETILSVMNQTYDNVEYIIIDGCSTDKTVDIIQQYDDKIDYWISERDNGIYDAMNKGVNLSCGEIIGIINADDWFEINTIKIIVEKYQMSDKKSILHGYMNIIKDEKLFYISRPTLNLSLLKKGMILNHPTVFIPKSLYKSYGLFSTEYKIASDWELILRFYLNNVNFIQIKSILANFRLGGVSFLINTKLITEKYNIRHKHKTYKLIDFYYVYDLIKLNLLGNLVSKVSLFKQSFLSKIK